MNQEKMTKKELEEACVKEGIILERQDMISSSTFFVPNMEKIRLMIREFDFLVEGASRGKAINEISKIELYLYENEDKPELQNNKLATNYSRVSIYLEANKDIIADKDSENWRNIFTQYFALEDIYGYFHKSEGGTIFFRKFKIFEEMVELNTNIKLMDYLTGQIEVFIPLDEDKIIPYKVDSLEMAIYIFEKIGLLDTLKEKMKDHYYVNGAKLLNTMLGKPSSNWKKINDILWDIYHQKDKSIMVDPKLQDGIRDILYHYKIDLR